MKALAFLVGKEVDIFNPQDTEAVDGLMASGRVLSITDGWLVLANPKSGEADFAVNLSHVGMVAVREVGPTMEALPGGKVHRLHRPAAGDEEEDEDEEQ
jgi:hypothetical protein